MFQFIEKHPFLLSLLIFCTIIVGGMVEVIPSFSQQTKPVKNLQPYTALQLAGRHIYIKENCSSCHSQLIRPFKAETDRYGKYSTSGEYVYDRPFLWGSRRIGPDLWRIGLIRSSDWHEVHFKDAQRTSPGSVMPDFPWFFENLADLETAYAEMVTIEKFFGVPYNQEGFPQLTTFDKTKAQALKEAKKITAQMHTKEVIQMVEEGEIPEIVAMIAYLNRLK